jgi:putative FmdB family regulatory protein
MGHNAGFAKWVLMYLCIDIYNRSLILSNCCLNRLIMPFYEYQCTSCRHEEEVLQKVGDKPLSKCPECGKNSMQKMISAAAFRLKGGGWYETDFKSGSKKNVAGDTGAEKKAGDSKKTSEKKSSGDSTKSKKIKE